MHLLSIVYYKKKYGSFESILRAKLDSFSSNHPVLWKTCKLALIIPYVSLCQYMLK